MMRLARARQLLARQAGTVSETAYRVGFQDPDHFSRLFMQTVGVVPSEYGKNRP
jgi:AraC-like DNA-binding protein